MVSESVNIGALGNPFNDAPLWYRNFEEAYYVWAKENSITTTLNTDLENAYKKYAAHLGVNFIAEIKPTRGHYTVSEVHAQRIFNWDTEEDKIIFMKHFS
jgi:hypothetical protein